MAAPNPGPSSSSRQREQVQREVTIGNFSRMEQIGRGSFATVYKAKHLKRGGYVAIKSVNLYKLNKKLKENLYGEIHILKQLHHPHIVALFDCKETSSHIHLVMEYCPMGDLSLFIRKRDSLARHADFQDTFSKYPNPKAGGLNEVLVRHFLKQLASALGFLRDKSLIHRDVKPQNLLINPSPMFYANNAPENVPYAPRDDSLIPTVGVKSLPMLKLADFGFARSLPTTALAETLCGSPLYMAPEILRYEKYDAKADLWSVGTVTYEMTTGKPPFRSSNHIDLLRKIEQAQDVIKFPEEPRVSRDMKTLVRSLMKRSPIERMGFKDFFDNTVIKDEIPGLVEEDRPQVKTSEPEAPKATQMKRLSSGQREQKRLSIARLPEEADSNEKFVDAVDYVKTPEKRPIVHHTATAPASQSSQPHQAQRKPSSLSSARSSPKEMPPPAVPVSRTRRTESNTSNHSRYVRDERTAAQAAQEAREAREEQERAAQEVAFERDYVVVEKRAVEMNAFADELAASPRIHANENPQTAMRRRNTTQSTSQSTGNQVTTTRALQIASGKRPEHLRQGSYERRLRSGISTSSAISKAINMASGRLFNLGLSPPLSIGRTGPSPPVYNPFPAYPTSTGPPLMIGDGGKSGLPPDEDAKMLHAVEESAHRSDVVYGFAEVKYKQLIPLAPSVEDQGLGIRPVGASEKEENAPYDEDDGLTVDAVITLSEEALVLYVKSLSLLAHSMDIAGAWWAKKNRGEVVAAVDETTTTSASPSARSAPINSLPHASSVVGARVNKVVQWVRDRFNEVLEKAEFVRLKLLSAQKRLPSDHPSHPDNHHGASSSSVSTGIGGSASASASSDSVRVSPGVSAEKLMYTRALEMGRGAAVNELVGQDLAGCEIAYVTAIRMLEAVLDSDEEVARKVVAEGREAAAATAVAARGEGVEDLVNAEDREAVVKVVQSFRSRLLALQRKLKNRAEQNAHPSSAAKRSKSPTAATTGTSPR